ncbi:MAG: adenylate/guanylate cyclase domain-containing protein [Candidatus Hodarchaeales archaeon]|jgi:class 3 adenylate cyclase
MLLEELKYKISELMNSKYEIVNTDQVPDRDDVTFKTKSCFITTSVLNIDIRDSTKLLKKHKKSYIAKMLRSFHLICTKIIKNKYGHIRSFNGDSLLAFYDSEFDPCNNAVECAFNIKYCIGKLIKPYFGDEFDYGIGIDYGKILVTKAGFKGDYNNDLVWIGEAVNNAVKFGNKTDEPNNIVISEKVFKALKKVNRYKIKSFLGIADYKTDIWNNNSISMLLAGFETVEYFTAYERKP